MKNFVSRFTTTCSLVGLALVLTGFAGPQRLFADEGAAVPGESVRSWDLQLGAGAAALPKYSGFDELNVEALPVIAGRYRTTYVDLFVETLNGAGVTFKFPQYTAATLSAGLNAGRRHSREHDEADILEGTPDIEAPLLAFGSLDVPLPVGKLSAKLSFIPITAEYSDSKYSDEEYDGMLGEVSYNIATWVRRNVRVNAGIGFNWMNDDYAAAHYGVERSTDQLSAFSAGSGVRDMYLSLGGLFMFSKNWSTGLTFNARNLVGDAADSPLTVETFQPSGGLFAFYNF